MIKSTVIKLFISALVATAPVPTTACSTGKTERLESCY